MENSNAKEKWFKVKSINVTSIRWKFESIAKINRIINRTHNERLRSWFTAWNVKTNNLHQRNQLLKRIIFSKEANLKLLSFSKFKDNLNYRKVASSSNHYQSLIINIEQALIARILCKNITINQTKIVTKYWKIWMVQWFNHRSELDMSRAIQESSRTYNIKCGLILIHKQIESKNWIIKKEFFDKLAANKLVKLVQEQKRKELLSKVGKAFTFLNRIATRQKWGRGFRQLLINTHSAQITDKMRATEEELKSTWQKSESIVKKELEYKIQEYESKISVLKLSQGKLENENEEIKDELEDIQRNYSFWEQQNKLLNDKIKTLEEETDKLYEEKNLLQKQIKDLSRESTSLSQSVEILENEK